MRHGSLLGIKYLVAVRQEMLQELLPRVLPACMAGLEDADDDVRAVAAEALTPAAAAIVASAGAKHVTAILLSLWDILLDLDDLSPSTSSVMHLLAELYSQPQVESKTVMEKPMLLDLNETMMDEISGSDSATGVEDDPFLLSTLAPRLWPFMRHNITSVRLAAIRTLERLLESGDYRAKGDTGSSWAVPILGDALRMVFQNLLLESDEAVIQCSQRVWRLLLQCPEEKLAEEATSYLSSWLKLASTAAGAPLETSKMYSPNSLPRKSRGRAVAKLKAVRGEIPAVGESSWQPPRPNNKVRDLLHVIVGADGEKSAVLMRVTTARALGILAASLPSALFPTVANLLTELLSSSLGTQRQVASMVIVSWFKEMRVRMDHDKSSEAATAVQPMLVRLLELLGIGDPSSPTPGSSAPYGELSRMFAKMRTEAGALIKHTESLGTFKRSVLASLPSIDTISAEAAIELASKLVQPSQPHGDADDKSTSASDSMELARQRLLATAGYLQVVQGNLHMSVLASLAGAVVWMGELPVKLNPIIQPLMAAIKREQEEALQQPAAEALAEIIVQCVGRKPSPNEKLIKNLCALTCADPVETPKATQANASAVSIEEAEVPSSGKGNKHAKVAPLSAIEERARAEGAITRRGAESALKSLCNKFGSSLLNQLPKLWDCLTESFGQPALATSDQASIVLPVLTAEPQALITNLQVVRSMAPVVDKALHPKMLLLLPAIFACVRHDHAAVRLVASRCLTATAQTMLEPVMASVLITAVPMLGDTTSVEARQGSGMLITALVEGLGTELVAYASLLIVPLLGCMSDSNHHVRQSVTKSFAALVPLLPLARGVPPPKGLDEFQASRSADDTRFLEQLLDNSQVDDYKLQFPLNVTLRRYQQEGINWLAFLKRFKLHGILCDDMGLGKTLQASAIVASDTVERANAFAVSKSPDVAPLPSLVVCPSTLVGHWAFEIEKFIPTDILNPLQYAGSPQERIDLRSRFPKHNIIITSYDVLRKDIDYLATQVWNYCILDEGHIIKSAKSKITMAAKRVQADHRLLLSGTPIQNNVLELWSLFDFLMPGFLGTERQFQANYGKPLQASREGKCSSKEAEAGVLAMEALHKQVMPFLLRRTKDEVLADLPPKIIQDRYCDLSPLQLQLYEDFSHSQAKQEISSLVEHYGGPDASEARTASAPSTHVFQALQYLRKLCSHPLLVLEDERQAARHVDAIAQSGAKDLHELHHAPKLQALRDILEECGIGVPAAAESSASPEGGHHRVLIFAQLKNFLDIIEKDLFQTHMKGVTYLRLDGSVESDKRFDIVKAFNSDPTIDVLLLTTHVGGLGLNLTAADTVVFMEHDWNPMRDLQAMDRAHRLGQKRVVNVHRLIMRGTLEEKIMSLQRFKISVANTVINAENASLNTMDTTQLLDLFTVSKNAQKASTSMKAGEDESDAAASVGVNKGLKAMLNNLEELWDQSQYSEEYNLVQFVSRLNG